MVTQNQIAANRKNAKKSTGPRTPEGKSTVAQNATKHGLTAQKPLIPGEDPEQFAIFTESMLADLNPQGPLETVLANRIITLTWQLNRAPRLQAAAFNFMMKDLFRTPSDPEEHIGKTIVDDIGRHHILEKLQTYEQKIENNLYKTIEKLEKIQNNRKNSQNFQQNQNNSKKPDQNQKIPQKAQPDIPTKSTNYELKTTNSIPQNKPNSEQIQQDTQLPNHPCVPEKPEKPNYTKPSSKNKPKQTRFSPSQPNQTPN